MASIDWIILGLYLAVIAWMGTSFARRQKTTESYFIGGRSVPWWAIGLSFFGTSISTGTFVAIPGQAYGGDWRPHLANMMLPVAALFAVWYVVPLYRRKVKMSAYEYLEERFGYGARFYTSVIYLSSRLFKAGLVLFLMAKAISAMTGWNPFTIILISGLVAIIYTMMGGLEAVIWTDVLQSVTLFAGGLICLGVLWFGTDQGGNLLPLAWEAGKFRMADFSLDWSRMTVLVTVFYGVFGAANSYTTYQDSTQRFLAASSTRDAQKSVWMGVVGCLITWNIFMLIGTSLHSYYQIHVDQLPAEIAASEMQVFPYFVASHLPVGVTGLILAGMCAAAMSSLDTMINSMAMVTVRDFYLRLRPQASDRRQLWLGRVASCFWGGLGAGAGLLMLLGVEKAMQFSFTMFSILGGGLFGLFLLAFFVPRAHALGVYVGLACGVLISGWALADQALVTILTFFGREAPTRLIESLRYPFHPWMTIFVSNLASFTVGWIASWLLPPRRA